MKIFKIFIKTKKLGKTRKSFELLELELGSIITESSRVACEYQFLIYTPNYIYQSDKFCKSIIFLLFMYLFFFYFYHLYMNSSFSPIFRARH